MQKHPPERRPRDFALALAFAFFASAACTSSAQSTGTTGPASGSEDSPEQTLYKQALEQAKNPTPEKISRSLTVIGPDNKELVRRTIDGREHILVATWTSTFKYYESSLGDWYNTGTYDTWVTAAPNVQNLCRDSKWQGGDVNRRLIRLLGLPPGGDYVGFASMWVQPQDLYRPCPDSEITDSECGLNFPDDVTPEHRKWINDLRAKQYFVSKNPQSSGWPWTQLGYTYDWHGQENPETHNPVGVSEFLIKQNAKIKIEALTPTEEYCKAQ